MAYPQTVRYLESFIDYEKINAWPYGRSLKLGRFREFLDALGNPQDALRCIHIAGTKGKGSTCAFIAYILRQAGYRVGLYTSPHLVDFRERIRILKPKTRIQEKKSDFEGMISRDDLKELVIRIRPDIQKFNARSRHGPLSFFEVYTALAFIYFQEKKADPVVLETGLGGRLDATNVVRPLVCAITPISYEHTQKLGSTLSRISFEKSGIIKSNNLIGKQLTVISAPQEREAMRVIKNKCQAMAAKLYVVKRDIVYKRAGGGFTVMGLSGKYRNLRSRLLGEHQLINAAVAIGVVEALQNCGIPVSSGSLRRGIHNTIWPGRCEVISRNPLVVLDGAQNVASTSSLIAAIKDNFKYKKLILVLGISSDKDIKGICDKLSRIADEIILTKSGNPRATPPEELAKYLTGKNINITDNVTQAKGLALRISDRKDLVLVCGSLFVVGEFRNAKIRP
jgi:dihydrofolate synthase/folylpolyglutamate synthase